MAHVSVVIPAYEAAGTLAAAVDSVLAQTFSDLDVVVVDDGSSDATSEVARSYGEPVTCIRTENGGVSRARNAGIAASSGELIALLDADDLWEPPKLQRQVDLLQARPAAGICTTGSLRVGPALEPLEVNEARDPADACEALLLGSMVLGAISSPLILRDVATQAGGFDPRLSQCADWDYFLRLARLTEFGVIPEPLVRYRVSPGSMSGDIPRLERETFLVLDEFFAGPGAPGYRGLRGRCYANHWMILSGSYLHAGERRAALRCLANGARAHPASLTRPLGLPVRWVRRLRGAPNGAGA